MIFVLRVVQVYAANGTRPLVYWGSEYRSLEAV